MKYTNLIISILLLFAVGYIYNKFKINVERDDKKHELSIIKKYLLKEQDYFTIEQLSSINKPILWIFADYEINSRKWESFMSRSSKELNQDYLYLTIRSIINHNSDHFHIIILDDESFPQLLDDWTVDLTKIGNAQKENIRTFALVKILHKYGGMLIPPSFISFKSLKPIYDKVLSTNTPTIAEFPNDSTTSYVMNYKPSTKFIGCVKNCEEIYNLGKNLEIIVNTDYTNNSKIEGQISNLLYKSAEEDKMNYIDGKFIGVKDSDNKSVDLERLMGSTYIDLNPNSYGLYIPYEDLLKRNAYNWFVYLPTEKVLESNTNIGKYLLISNN